MDKDEEYEKHQGEAWISYAWRQLCEKPHMVLAIIGLVAAGFLYDDLRDLMHSQTQTNIQIANELRELNIRVAHLEAYNKKPKKKTEDLEEDTYGQDTDN